MIPLDSPDKRLFPTAYVDVPTVTTNSTTSPEVSYEKVLARAGETIARLTRQRDELAAELTQCNNEWCSSEERLFAQIDEAVAQRDRAVKVCRLVEWSGPLNMWDNPTCPDCEAPQHQGHSDGCDLATVLRGDPVPDRLAAEREAGRREKAEFEAAAKKIYEGFAFLPGYVPWVEGGNSDKQEEARHLVRRALRDTPASPETGKSEEATS